MKREFIGTDRTEADIAWATGLYEGEGTIIQVRSKGYATGRIHIRMCDREPLEECARIWGGTVSGPYRDKGVPAHHKDKFSWIVHSWRDVMRICEEMRPRLSPRRVAQMDKVLAQRPDRLPKGVRNCPPEPIASQSGYYRHIGLREEPCDICRKSLYLAQKVRWSLDMPAKCPTEIVSSYAGHLRHRQNGTEICDICRASARLYDANRRRRLKSEHLRPAPRAKFPAGCPTKPIPSAVGYNRHLLRGETACAMCKASNALAVANRRRRKREAQNIVPDTSR